jgi:hypothetical protein
LQDSRSWSVRDAACVATGRFTLAYPEVVRPYLGRMYALWFGCLCDPSRSVREAAAVTLAMVIQAYGPEVRPCSFPHSF